MQGEFIIYTQKLKHAAEEYQSMCRLLCHAADRISDIEKELDTSSYDGIKDTLRTLHDSITCHAANLQKFETILYDCAAQYIGTEERLHTAFSPENTSESADSQYPVLENADSRKGDGSMSLLEPSVSNTVEKYLAEELRKGEIHLNVAETTRLSGTDELFIADSTFTDSSSMDSSALSGDTENSGNLGSSGESSEHSDSSGNSGGFGDSSSASNLSGNSGNSGGFGDSSNLSGSSDGSGNSGGFGDSSSASNPSGSSDPSLSTGAVSQTGTTAKWTKAASVPTAADIKNYGTYRTENQPLQAASSKTSSLPDVSTTAKTSPASALFSEHAGASILATAALGTAGVIGAGFAHKSKTKTE